MSSREGKGSAVSSDGLGSWLDDKRDSDRGKGWSRGSKPSWVLWQWNAG
jgi:hypothetical protein